MYYTSPNIKMTNISLLCIIDHPVKRHYLPGWWSISLSDNARPLRGSDPGAPSFALLVFSASARDANMQSDEDIILGRKSHGQCYETTDRSTNTADDCYRILYFVSSTYPYLQVANNYNNYFVIAMLMIDLSLTLQLKYESPWTICSTQSRLTTTRP